MGFTGRFFKAKTLVLPKYSNPAWYHLCLNISEHVGTIKSFNPSVGKALPKCRAIAPFLFSFSIPLCGLGVCTAAKCCLNLVFKGSVSLRESSDLDGSFLCFYDP